MPFVDLNSLQTNNGAMPAATPAASSLPVIPADSTTPPATTTVLPALPSDNTVPAVNEIELPATPAAVPESLVQAAPEPELPVAVSQPAVVEPTPALTPVDVPLPGTIEFETPRQDQTLPEPTPAADAVVTPAAPVPAPVEIPEVPAVVVEPVTPVPAQADALESAQADMAATVPAVVAEPALPAAVPEVQSAAAPVMPAPAMQPEVSAAPVVTTEATLGDDQTAAAAADPAVLAFTSTPDADDLDKPPVVSLPAIKISEDVEVKAEPNGMREVVGPDFDQPTSTPLEQINAETIDQKLANLGNMMVETPASSTATVSENTVAETSAGGETSATELPPLPQPGVSQNKVEVEPEVTSATTVMKADALDLSAISSVPTAPAEVLPPVTAVVDPVPTDTLTAGDLPAKTYDLNELLAEAITMKASDLHLTVGYRAMARVDGKLSAIKSNVMDNESIKAMVAEVTKGRELGDIDDIRDYDLSYKLPDNSARFRVNIFRQQESLAMVLRLIPTQILSIEALKLPPVIREFTKFSSGLVLFTGPTGSGKSTTIASLLNEINLNEPRHIVTIEDPVEYVYPHGLALIDQREIFTDSENWTDALRSVLRQDPDVVLIGEMRDLETISSAIRVAETGHLVFATLHTNSASQSVDRIIDVFPEGQQTQIRAQLASVLQAVVSQRLVPVTGGGRRVAAEVLIATPAVRNAIRDDKAYQIDNMIQTSAELGMITMEKSLVGLVREGLISTEMAEEYSNKPTDVLSLLGQNH